MALHQFVLLLERPPTNQQAQAVVSAHRDLYLAPEERKVTVQRRADSLPQAVISAVDHLEAAGLTPVRVCDSDWVTLGHIAERIGRSREIVRLWSIGEYGPGGFPPPLNPGRDTRFYSWTEVATWLRRHTDLPVSKTDPVLVIANLLLQVRHLAPRLPDRDVLSALLEP
jgi:hypothetical protein